MSHGHALIASLVALLLGACTSPVKGYSADSAGSDSGHSGGVDSPATLDSRAETGGETGEETGPETGSETGGETGGETGADTGAETGDTGSGTGPPGTWAAPCSSYDMPAATGIVEDTNLDELSGLAVSRRTPDVLWVHEDHLGEAAIYAVSSLGETLAKVTLDGATNNDWEDIAAGPCGDDWCLFIGEVGNNDGDRTDLGVYVLVEPDLDTIADGELVTSDWTWYPLVYPDGGQNAEALAVTSEGLPVVLTKRYDDETSYVYVYPYLDASAEVTLVSLGSIVTGDDGAGGAAALTAADLWPDDSRLIYRTYGGVRELDLDAGLGLVSTAPTLSLPASPEPHGEAVAYDPWTGGNWQLSEGINPGLYFSPCVL